MRVGQKIIANFLVVGAATEVEEIDGDFIAGDIDFFDTVVNADGGDVLLNESAFAVAFDDTGLAGFFVSNRDEFE